MEVRSKLQFCFPSMYWKKTPYRGTSRVSRLQVGKKWHFWRLVVSVKAYQTIKTFLLFFSFWRMEEVSVIQHSCWVYNLLPLLVFEERFIASCGNTEYSKGTPWFLDPCLPSIFINTLLSFLLKSGYCWLLPALSYLTIMWSWTTFCFAPVVCVEIILSC